VNILPTLTLLLGLSGALWWIGRTSITAEFQVKLRAWLAGTALACLAGLAAFGGKMSVGGLELVGLQDVMRHRLDKFVVQKVDDFLTAQGPQTDLSDPLLASPDLTRHVDEIHWVPFSQRRLQNLIDAKRTVMVDFTADWCLTCKALETTVLNTQEVRDSLSEKGVVTLLADWTNYPPEISETLEALAGSKQVPVLAIFPAGRPEERIVLLGGYTKATVLEKLAEAGPSQVVDNVAQLVDTTGT
jgi:thiol:disulfide interchange protein